MRAVLALAMCVCVRVCWQTAEMCVCVCVYTYICVLYIYIHIYTYTYIYIYIYTYIYIYIYVSDSTQTERHRLTPHRKINRIYIHSGRYVYVGVFHSVEISNKSRFTSTWLHTITQWHTLIEKKKPPPSGGVPIYYVPSSRTVSKTTRFENDITNHTVLDEGCNAMFPFSINMFPLRREHSKYQGTWREMGGWGRVPFSRNLMRPTPRHKWYLTTGCRAH